MREINGIRKRKKVYYAHSIKIYDTPQEKRELEFLSENFDVFNPNTEIQYNSQTQMTPYFEAVKKSDILITSEYKKHIGKGVFREISLALKNNIPSFVLREFSQGFKILKIKDVKIRDKTDSKIYYGFIKLKKCFFKPIEISLHK